MIRKVLIWPNPELNRVSEPIDPNSDECRELVVDLIDTMIAKGGIGISAIQIGVPARVLVIRDFKEDKNHKVLVNPVIRELIDDPFEVEEGCLSFPGVYDTALRHPEAVVRYESPSDVADDGGSRLITDQFSGLEAQVVQHEMEHLDGRLFVSTGSVVKRDIIRRKISKHLKLAKRRR